jgi:small subunit ribosomal protein S6e
MTEFKLVIGNKDGKSIQKALKEPESNNMLGLKMGEKISGDKIGMPGYEFEVCGGSDYCGFPMRKDYPGTARKTILMTFSTGMNDRTPGIRRRKTVCGNQIHNKITQINLKITKEGKEALVGDVKSENDEAAKKRK